MTLLGAPPDVRVRQDGRGTARLEKRARLEKTQTEEQGRNAQLDGQQVKGQSGREHAKAPVVVGRR